MQPQFVFEPTEPDNGNRLRVRLKETGEALGVTYLTAGDGWAAEHAGLTDSQGAVRGFTTEHLAAEFMHRFKPPERSDRTNPTSAPRSLNPELLPEHGVLISLVPINEGDFFVDMTTKGVETDIGYLQRGDDGRYEVRVGHRGVGRCAEPETGMWACLQLHTQTKHYAPLADFVPYKAVDAWVNGTITFRGETEEAVIEAIDLAVENLTEGGRDFKSSTTTFDVQLSAEG